MRAWRKANRFVRSGNHAKAIYWLSRVRDILDAGPPQQSAVRGFGPGYMVIAALCFLAILWAAKSI
jgi:hypothetical protein